MVKVIVVKRWFPGNTSFKTTAEMVIEMNERLMELSLLPKNIIGFAIDSDGCWVLMYYDAIGSVTKSSDYDDSEPPFTVDPNFFEHLLNCMDNQKFIQSYPTEEIQERMKAALEEGGNSEMTEEALEDWSGGMSREEAQKVIDEANQTARHLLNNHILQHKAGEQ